MYISNIHIYIYIHVYIYVFVYVYIYIYMYTKLRMHRTRSPAAWQLLVMCADVQYPLSPKPERDLGFWRPLLRRG